MPTFSLKTGVGLAVVLLGLGLTAHFIIVQKRTEELTAQLIGEGSNVQDPNENPEISELLAQGHLIPPMLESLLRIEWRYSMARIKRPTILMRGVNWVIGRDEETYGKATRSNNVRIVRSGSLSSVAGVLCVGIGDLDEECVSANRYQSMTAFQRISRLHGLRQILWTKDGFCNTINYALSGFKDNFKGLVMQPFTFPCFTLPDQYRALETYANAKQAETPVGETLKWIVKPTDRGAGIGIYVVDSLQPLDELRKEGAFLIVQPYMNDPYLIDGYKFDLRTYVLVTSISPLRIYMYKEGLVRFASSRYDVNATTGGKKTQFLTNTSINKKFKDVNELVWRFSKFKAYLASVGQDPDIVFARIYQAVTRIFLSSEAAFRRHFEKLQSGYTCINCYQLLGVDVIFDENLTPRIIEVNGSPDMGLSHARGSAYDATKIGMMTDVLNVIYRRASVAVDLAQDLSKIHAEVKTACGASTRFCIDDIDLEYLLDAKRERMNRGGFSRLYPTANGGDYTDYVRHVDSLASDSTLSEVLSDEKVLPRNSRGTWRLHILQTALEKLYEPSESAASKRYKALMHNAIANAQLQQNKLEEEVAAAGKAAAETAGTEEEQVPAAPQAQPLSTKTDGGQANASAGDVSPLKPRDQPPAENTAGGSGGDVGAGKKESAASAGVANALPAVNKKESAASAGVKNALPAVNTKESAASAGVKNALPAVNTKE
eukprot:Opistho-2@15650